MISASDHVVVDATKGGAFLCLRCGAELRVGYPIALSAWGVYAKAFTRRHRTCTAPTPTPEEVRT